MCLAVPGKILNIREGSDALDRVGVVDFHGSQVEASLAMIPEAKAGDWVLVHAGFALTVMDEAEAAETWQSLKLALGDDFEIPGQEPGSS